MRRLITLSMVLVSLPAIAELQNIIVNGYYAKTFTPTVSVVDLLDPQENSTAPLLGLQMDRPEDDYRLNDPTFGSGLRDKLVPVAPTPTSYPGEGCTMLSFYVCDFGEQDEEKPLGLLVSIDGYRVLTLDRLPTTWQPILLDMQPWQGETVSLSFRVFNANYLRGRPASVVIAKPRFVTWHGPYYYGAGGIMIPGRYGGYVTGSGREFKNVGTDRYDGAPLVVTWYDFHEPSVLRVETSTSANDFALGPGVHILPAKLNPAGQFGQKTTVLSGKVESGRIDIIPDFMKDDDAALKQLEADAKAALAQAPAHRASWMEEEMEKQQQTTN